MIRFRSRRAGASTFADLVGATIREVTLNGRALDPAEVYADHRIRLDDLAEDNELRVVADCTYSHTGEGLHRFVDPADDRVYLYSQMEVPDARRVFTTFEQPDLKAVFDFTVTAPSHWEVVSNAPTPEPEPAAEGSTGMSVWRFPTTERMSTYVTAVVAGEYHEVLDTYVGKHGEIPLGHYCRQSMVPHLDIDELVEITKQGFAFFEEAFDFPYPFHKYDQLYVPEFNNGAMENAGCVTLRDEYLPRSRQARWFYEQRANTVLHEMAHMWFGDLVTMRWWDDLWLNESFAEWASTTRSVEATKYDEAWTGFTNTRKNWAYRQDQLPSTHPIAADNSRPGGRRGQLRRDHLRQGRLVAQAAGRLGRRERVPRRPARLLPPARLRQLRVRRTCSRALEETSGRDLGSWAEEWLQTCGVNTLARRVRASTTSGRFTSFAVAQSARPRPPDAAPAPHRRRPLRPRRATAAWSGVRRWRPTSSASAPRCPSWSASTSPTCCCSTTATCPTPRSASTSGPSRPCASPSTLDDSLARALCWGALWDMTRDAELSAGDFVRHGAAAGSTPSPTRRPSSSCRSTCRSRSTSSPTRTSGTRCAPPGRRGVRAPARAARPPAATTS